MLELLVGLIVLAVVAAIAFWLVRRELRPLVRIEDTAAAIAGGDLTQRVPEEAPGTEVGDLARSLNMMLAQIEQAFEQRRQSEERLRRFVSDASHELRTPLTSVRGFAELFHRGAASRPDDLALAMSRIESEAERMGVIVEDLLLLANLDQGRPLAQQRFDLEAVLAEMVADHAMLHSDWPISFGSSGGSDLVGDELRIRQAVANLLANARAHTPSGTSVAVTLATEGDDRTVAVSDNGPGIAADDLPHLFERFYRVDASRARRSGGSGLGLAIVQAIAEAHGGSVAVASIEGEGAAFTIGLPIAGRSEATGHEKGLASA
jgi:two-component system OmpR family sensor kinase